MGRAFGWLCLFPTIIVVYATTIQVNVFQDGLVENRCNRSLGLTLKLTVFDVTPSVIFSWDRIAACQYLLFFLSENTFFFLVNVVQLTTLLDIVVGGRLGVNFFPPTATSDFAGPPRTGMLLLGIVVIRIGWVTLTYFFCYVVRPVASDVRWGNECSNAYLLCVISYYDLLPSLSLRLLQLSIAIGAVG